MWDVLSIVYKCEGTKTKQNKMEELADKLGFVQTFQFFHPFLFLLISVVLFCFLYFSSSVSPFYASATALNLVPRVFSLARPAPKPEKRPWERGCTALNKSAMLQTTACCDLI